MKTKALSVMALGSLVGASILGIEARAQVDSRSAGLEGAPLTRTTSTGHVFTRDTSVAALGEAWRDESGMIWGELVMGEGLNGIPIRNFMNYDQASRFCRSIGAQLPSRADFERLRSYMGAMSDSSSEYTPQVLPNFYGKVDGLWEGVNLWSTSSPPDDWSVAYVFDSSAGSFSEVSRDPMWYNAVRCVTRR